jgi:hypothetical protein
VAGRAGVAAIRLVDRFVIAVANYSTEPLESYRWRPVVDDLMLVHAYCAINVTIRSRG